MISFNNIIYEENYNCACFLHKINNIIIYYNVPELKIIYHFQKFEFNQVKKLIYLDYVNSSFIVKIIINNSIILENNNLKTSIQSLTNDSCCENVNQIELCFDQNRKLFKNIINEYLWFIYLVRYEIFKDKENYYYFNKTIKKREQCLTLEELNKLFNTLFNYSKL